jgi:glycosyltransferase involved in cell wall biosynthesis
VPAAASPSSDHGGSPKILAFAYACEPGKGSEPGAGWAWAGILGGIGETWIITRANNREAIEAALPSVPSASSLHFVYVDLPARARRWKRGQRGIHLYYLLWQRQALERARQLEAEHGFDLVWHLTMANVWMGSLAARVGPPFIYGPVGGGIEAPWSFAPLLGVRGLAFEGVRTAAQLAGRYLNPIARDAWRRARVILVQNPETRTWLPPRHRGKAIVLPNAIAPEPPDGEAAPRGTRSPTAIYVGRLLPWKGVALAIRAIAKAEGWRLIVIGSGSDAPRLRRLVRDLGVGDRVEFTGTVEHERVVSEMRDRADVFLFPSLREEAGLVVLEALTAGLPVICLDRGGPPILAGDAGLTVASSGSSSEVADGIADLLIRGVFPDASTIAAQAVAFSETTRGATVRSIVSARASGS